MTDRHPSLSIAVITLNEVDRIGALLKSVEAIRGEVVVVDSGSDDGTVDVCRNAGARVIHQDWLGYAGQKQFAMEQAQGDWVLNLDADEALTQEGAREILEAVESAAEDLHGFSMPRLSRYLKRWIRCGGWFPDRKMRLVRRGKARWVGRGIHERLEVEGRTEKLNEPLLHFVYRDISDQVRTINSFSSVFAEAKGPTSSWYVLWGLAHACGKFLECAIWKLGILDGLPGLIIAVNSSFYVFLKHAKSWEKGLPPDAGDENSPRN